MTNKTELYSSFKTKKTTNDNLKSFAAPIDNEGAAIVIDTPNINAGVNAGGFFGTYVDMEGSAKTEADLIKKYREAAAYPECDMAIEDIVNEAISDLENESVVRIILDDIDVGIGLKKKMEAEFKSVLKLLDFKSNAHSIFKRWYIDGRIYFHKILDTNNPAGGIQELRYLDPRRMKKVVSVEQQKDKRTGNIIFGKKSEFFVYTTVDQNAKSNAYQFQGQNSTKGIKIPVEEIAYCTSGEIDYDRNIVMSFLHKALKIVNQIRMMEDAMVIYRMSRAAERRIFYVNTGNMPKAQSEAHVNDLMNRYRNKSVYDSSTGELRDDRKFSAMIEDFWIPRQDGSNSTEIDTLEGGTNMSDLGDVAYFQKNLYKALNIPASRIGTDGTMINFGRQSEVNRDEIKFSKFVQRLRLKFQEILIDVLKTQLILKGIFTAQDWESVVDDIVLEFSQDSYYAETKESEIIRNRVEILNEMQPLVGVYFDREYVFKKILRLTDDEIIAMQEGISNDLALGYGMGGMPVPPPEEQDNNIPDGNMPALPQQPQG